MEQGDILKEWEGQLEKGQNKCYSLGIRKKMLLCNAILKSGIQRL